ncbi:MULTISPECIES: hypothetical protein [Actinosynnema]|uniref:Uncharacterized protein n=1 Tax=Actinosynnema pretiosum TaxID=42197 RepID=A0A290ZEV3_9PSEU|nr:hypothetical protein [Actinosynnema pretiosum]ATE57537.1 hypothetical protein CNX65_33005 [Actinosynnema pretiosum]
MSGWRTPDVVTAEDVFARSIADAERIAREAAKARPGREPSAEDIKRVIAYAKSPEASPELRALQDRIARGALSWREVLSGEAGADRGVRAAFEVEREKLAELCVGEKRPPAPPKRAPRDDDDAPTSFTEDAW